ncbi:MAG: FKBP-type peptidyl-prolyl cis-trans isomerase [Saprospiraceae bacterium]|nr:FKBP-type peptidyl-prolyl cis-trans isomerase [Saprospiraceae bacterium]
MIRINFFNYLWMLLLAVALPMTSCLGPSQSEEDEDIILDYISKNKLTAIRHNSGIYYIIKTEGTGNNPTINNTVTVHYKGYLTNGNQFDGTTTNPATFPLYNLIQGWQIGIPLIKKGGEIKLIIPSSLGYGSNSPSNAIPSNSVLVFDIQLVDFK